MTDVLRIVAVLCLIAANAFFVIGEYSIVTARRAALAPRAAAGSAGARSALRLMDDPVRVISAAQIGITAIGILTGALGEPTIHRVLGDGMPRWLSFVLAFGLVAYVTVVLGELVPKALTLQRAEACASAVARPMELIATLLTPAIVVLEFSAVSVLRPLGIRKIIVGRGVQTAAELREVVGEAQDAGVIPLAQEELLTNVFGFTDRQARDIMVPASHVVWLDASSTMDAAIEVVFRDPHTRYPVVRGDFDHLVGIAHVRDLVREIRDSALTGTVGDLARTALVVPETKELGALLTDLREQQQHLAIVVDQNGRPTGIVTMEDVVEEIVGEITDEFDLPGGSAELISRARRPIPQPSVDRD